jgi:20S proteasome alpha/beta subunit
MFTIDEHIHCTASGLMFDATALVQECQSFAAAYTSLFGCRIPVQRLVAEICEQKQQSTQLGGLRPFGASLVIVGWDGQGFQLYTTSPGGDTHSAMYRA